MAGRWRVILLFISAVFISFVHWQVTRSNHHQSYQTCVSSLATQLSGYPRSFGLASKHYFGWHPRHPCLSTSKRMKTFCGSLVDFHNIVCCYIIFQELNTRLQSVTLETQLLLITRRINVWVAGRIPKRWPYSRHFTRMQISERKMWSGLSCNRETTWNLKVVSPIYYINEYS